MKNFTKTLFFVAAILFFAACEPLVVPEPEPEQPIGTDPVERMLLLEKFTGDECIYCPWGAEDIAAGIQGNEDRVILVAHHVGYNEDRFTIIESRPLKFFYGSGSTYAPAAMLDRTVIRGSVPVMDTEYVTKSRVKAQLDKPSYVTIDLKTTYDASTKELKVDVAGELREAYPNAKLNVYIIQDNIIARQAAYVDEAGKLVTLEDAQSGNYTGEPTAQFYQNYNHRNTLRAVLTETEWGDQIGAETTARYSKSYTYTIPSAIKGVKNISIPTDVNNMYVVAFVADYIDNTAANRKNSEVHNAAIKKILE